MSTLRRWVDPFVLLLLATLAAGLLVPVPETARGPLDVTARAGIALLFFTYGLRLPTREVHAGLRNIRLQGTILAVTFALWPLVGLGPCGGSARAAIALQSFACGLLLPAREGQAGLRNIRLQGTILAVTFVLWPLVGLGLSWASGPMIGTALATGVVFLSVLPSTVQGSVALDRKSVV